jgi:AraC-like DNA-binding protein
MSVVLDTSTIPPADRPAAIDAVFAEATVPHSITHEPPPEDIYARLDYWPAGKAALFRHESSGIRHTRTARQLRIAAPERIALIVHQGGPGIFMQGENQFELRDGHLYLADLTLAYTIFRHGPGAATVMQVDYDYLGLPVETIRGAGSRLGSSCLYDLVRSHVPMLYEQTEGLSGGLALTSAVHATTELVRALVATASADKRFEQAALADTLHMRVVSYISQHLAEPDLSPQRIAQENNISVRHLHKMWQSAGLSLTQWIIAQRLEGTRYELSQQPPRGTISAICHGWGFNDVTHFCRRFRAAFGMSPSEWRRACRDTGRPDLVAAGPTMAADRAGIPPGLGLGKRALARSPVPYRQRTVR